MTSNCAHADEGYTWTSSRQGRWPTNLQSQTAKAKTAIFAIHLVVTAALAALGSIAPGPAGGACPAFQQAASPRMGVYPIR